MGEIGAQPPMLICEKRRLPRPSMTPAAA
jgi:hypothetical protein